MIFTTFDSIYIKIIDMNIIYVLFDPRNDCPMYVGKSSVGEERALSHLHCSHNLKVREWVSELKLLNIIPNIIIIENNIDLENLSNREIYWIGEYYKINEKLFNIQCTSILKKQNIIDLYNIIDYELINKFKIFLEDIPKFIKTIRYLYNYTQADLCEKIDINRSTLSIIENGGYLSVSTLLKLINLANEYDNNIYKSKNKI